MPARQPAAAAAGAAAAAAAAAAVAAAAHAARRRARQAARRRRRPRGGWLAWWSQFRLGRGTPVDVRHDAVVAPEAHSVAADVGGAGHGDDEDGLGAGPYGGRLDGDAAARQESAVAVEEE